MSLPLTSADAPASWPALLARWDVAPGSASERALATAVLLDADRHPLALRWTAARLLAAPAAWRLRALARPEPARP